MTKDTDQITGQTKRCNACGIIKDVSDFNLRFDKKTPIPRPECRECQKLRTKKWRESPAGKAREEEYKTNEEIQRRIKANRKLPERLANDAARHKRWRDSPKGKAKLAAIAKRTNSKPESKRRRGERRKERYRTDAAYHADVALRAMVNRILVASSKSKDGKTFDILGYTLEQFIKRIEYQFLPGMTWENRGVNGWHIDHRKPVSAFLAQDITDPRLINALCNLRPMWASDNMKKGAAWPLPHANNHNESEVEFVA